MPGLKIRLRYQKLSFLFLNENICCGYSKEWSQWNGSFDYPKHMLQMMSKKLFIILHSTILFILTYEWPSPLTLNLLCWNSTRRSLSVSFLMSRSPICCSSCLYVPCFCTSQYSTWNDFNSACWVIFHVFVMTFF